MLLEKSDKLTLQQTIKSESMYTHKWQNIEPMHCQNIANTESICIVCLEVKSKYGDLNAR